MLTHFGRSIADDNALGVSIAILFCKALSRVWHVAQIWLILGMPTCSCLGQDVGHSCLTGQDRPVTRKSQASTCDDAICFNF